MTVVNNNKSIEVTEEMIRNGVAVLRDSDYGQQIRFETDESIVSRMYRAMHRSAPVSACTNQPAALDTDRSEAPSP